MGWHGLSEGSELPKDWQKRLESIDQMTTVFIMIDEVVDPTVYTAWGWNQLNLNQKEAYIQKVREYRKSRNDSR